MPQKPTPKATVKLPAKYFKEIGRVITIFACTEHALCLIAYRLLRLTPAEGRLAVRAARVGDYCRMIQDLLGLQSIKVTHSIPALAKDLKDLDYMRDWFSHGVWTKTGGTFRILATACKWDAGPLQGVSRRIASSTHPVRLDQITAIADEAHRLLTCVNDIYRQIRARQKASPQKPRATHPLKSGNDHPRPKKKAHAPRQ